MNHIQNNAFKFIKNEYNINDQLSFYEEYKEEALEILQDNFAIVLHIIVTCNIGVEAGGEDDEFLACLENKYITIKIIELYKSDTNDEEIEVDTIFKENLETLLNSQLTQ